MIVYEFRSNGSLQLDMFHGQDRFELRISFDIGQFTKYFNLNLLENLEFGF